MFESAGSYQKNLVFTSRTVEIPLETTSCRRKGAPKKRAHKLTSFGRHFWSLFPPSSVKSRLNFWNQPLLPKDKVLSIPARVKNRGINSACFHRPNSRTWGYTSCIHIDLYIARSSWPQKIPQNRPIGIHARRRPQIYSDRIEQPCSGYLLALGTCVLQYSAMHRKLLEATLKV